jgi:hypothetical protein
MMPDEYVRVEGNPRSPAWRPSNEGLRTRLGVMPKLEASLDRSRNSLLAMDLEGIERETREQLEIIRELEAAALPGVAATSAQLREHPDLVTLSPVELEELRKSETRVREAARLQAALLARARYKLRVLANMLGGVSKTYFPQRWEGLVGGHDLPERRRRA